MNPHNNDDLVQRFSMGRLQGAELTDFEAHLPSAISVRTPSAGWISCWRQCEVLPNTRDSLAG